jgi:hypothetical protein
MLQKSSALGRSLSLNPLQSFAAGLRSRSAAPGPAAAVEQIRTIWDVLRFFRPRGMVASKISERADVGLHLLPSLDLSSGGRAAS